MSTLGLKNLTATIVAVSLTIANGCNQPAGADNADAEASRSSSTSKSPQPAVTPLPFGGTLLVDADMLPTPGYKIAHKSQADLENVLNQGRVFYANQPESQITIPPGFENCFAELDSFAMEANKVSAKMRKTLDVSKCVALATNPSIKIVSIKATLDIFLYLSCSKGDVSGLNGKPFREMSTNLAAKSGCEEGAIHIEFLSVTEADAVYSPGIAVKFKRRTVSIDGTAKLTGCKFTVKNKIETRDNECINFAKDDYSFTGMGIASSFSDLYKFQFENVASDYNSPDNIWRSKGKIQLSVNNWAGSVVFSSSTEAPDYNAVDTSTQATSNGQLSAQPAGPDLYIPSMLQNNYM